MKRVQYEKSVKWKKCNTKNVQHEMSPQKVQHENSATRKKMRHEKSAT